MNTTDIEMVKLYWEEFKYRHENYWKLFFQFSYAIIFLLVVPYVYPEKIVAIKRYVVLFPICGIFLSLVAAWILGAEYKRIGVTHEKMTQLKSEEYKPIKFAYDKWDKILKVKIGHVVTATFLVGFLLLSIANLWILMTNNDRTASSIATVGAIGQSGATKPKPAVPPDRDKTPVRG